MPTATRYGAHGLRSLGNDARHMRRPIREADAEVAAAFADNVLEWFFCEFPHGPKLSALTAEGERTLGLCRSEDLCKTLLDLEQVDPCELAERCGSSKSSAFDKTPELFSVLAEKLLEAGKKDAARRVLEKGLEVFAQNLRLNQLMGLYSRRTGKFVEAIERLTPLLEKDKNDDETPGILAAAYKGRWEKDQNLSTQEKESCLEKAHCLYCEGWERRQNPDPWRGINAATTSLYLGRTEVSSPIAAGVKKLLLKRRSKLLVHQGSKDLALNYWDAVTLAEAQLLLNERDDAFKSYQEAVRRHPEQSGSISSTHDQAALILEYQAASPQEIEQFLRAFKV
jgi:tetratricopeptide (TPR) repeat protein